MRVMGLDIGSVRIGVALSDETGFLASPYAVIQRRSTKEALRAVVSTLEETEAGLVVVGLPVSLDGQLHAQALSVKSFAERLRRRLGVPLVYADETLSTVRAEELLREQGVRPNQRRERIDSAAAAIILQDYLDQQRRVMIEPTEGSMRYSSPLREENVNE
jgi:putative Holliday junction resolvase